MTRDEALACIRELMVDLFELDPARIVPEARLVDDLELDSIDAIDMIAKLHELTGERADESALKAIRTVGDVVDLALGQLEARSQPGP